jgi:hypothetical protein
MLTEVERMKHQLDLLKDIIDNRLTRKQLRARRDYFASELSELSELSDSP